jgi:hypothetical protein
VAAEEAAATGDQGALQFMHRCLSLASAGS